MAVLRITQKLTGLRRDLPSQLTAGSALESLVASARELAAESLPLVTELALAENYGLLKVSLELGVLTSAAELESDEPDAAEGTLTLHIDVVVADELAYNHRAPGSPISAYLDAYLAGMDGIFAGLPGAESFMSDIGVSDPAAQISVGTSVILCT